MCNADISMTVVTAHHSNTTHASSGAITPSTPSNLLPHGVQG